jgi:DNA-binding CsgD family transcriptional regulator
MKGPDRLDGGSAEIPALVVDALVWPLLLLHADGRLLHANAAALQVLATQGPLQLGPQQRLQTRDGFRAQAWQAALGAARAGQRRLVHWPGDQGCTAIVMPLAAPGTPPDSLASAPVLLVALGMASSPTGAESAASAPAARSRRADADTGAYAKAHGLTHAEARVLQHLALGKSPAQAAQALGVTVATVRSQAAAIRLKTGHSSTAALVSSAARNSPVWPDPPQAPLRGQEAP